MCIYINTEYWTDYSFKVGEVSKILDFAQGILQSWKH